eukprot:TRINITY_DN1502_c1_g1_i2.p3 TRINITY_DN1502_c1_g1~~TRINITY_DN1502_c1_g1_i2.p3  ORF type:complete len:118 (-),score=42.64 TRINITY_DN1502_c1_g1_i2:3-356(-)
MQDHPDGRVRLGAFHVFAAALDVLFAATPSEQALASAAAPGGSLSVAAAGGGMAHSFAETSIDMDKYTAGGQVRFGGADVPGGPPASTASASAPPGTSTTGLHSEESRAETAKAHRG